MKTKDPKKIPLFGRRLIKLRKGRHLTQAELANEIGISRQMISYFESRAMNPTVEVLRKLADYFGVPADYFLYDEKNSLERPGPKSILRRQLEQVEKFPHSKQKFVSDMLEGIINNN